MYFNFNVEVLKPEEVKPYISNKPEVHIERCYCHKESVVYLSEDVGDSVSHLTYF